ncbi:hypothetical protein VPHD249_0160 [Vibrio phage D249]|nr:hypothetical protein SIPHO036v1_70003 [Vibrio phage 70E38.1]QZI88052.1 hypothetical protein SIPHO041v1_p0141 [Vibrio phage 234P1]QZI88226.1 hypothetical protein SIPHO035v1_p0135 [Vibrio phage 234P7B]QZI88308.1 hypothetical protein SIPHO082v1_p0031 [Vibrio phage 294E48.1]QZI88592.1 hypothetical protein SIPHO037v1_p0151 [Vibrio phage 70E35.2]QZI88777.1 hypothetical protein SIPHO039v1_p0148 [Vibrio phage 70E35.5a]QZI88959.1 hypothetical protein SIPHO040v1_p0146 [Vibrio phage 70E35.6]QZI89061
MKAGQIFSYKDAGEARYEPHNLVVVLNVLETTVIFKTVAATFASNESLTTDKVDFDRSFEKYF